MDDAELLAAVVLALPTAGTQVEYARAALDALKPLIEDQVRREVGSEAVNVLRLKDQRIGELVEELEQAKIWLDEWVEWRQRHQSTLDKLRNDRTGLRVNVEHLRNVAQREIDAGFKVPGSFVATDIGRREALDDVLALMNRDDE